MTVWKMVQWPSLIKQKRKKLGLVKFNNMTIEEQINVISSVFDVDSIINESQTSNEVKSYYLANRLSYRVLHNWSGYIHMGLSKNGVYKKEDLLEVLHIIQRYTDKSGAKDVLELASGRGANSAYLATNNPEINFQSIDLSTLPLGKYRTINNYNYKLGSYDDLSIFPNEFEVIFVIESLCYSQDKLKTLQEVYSKLKPGGYFIVVDAYSTKEDSEYSKIDFVAKKLVEKSMTVQNFITLQKFRSILDTAKFEIEEEVDYSQEILPSLYRFQKMSKWFFKYPAVAKILKTVSKEVWGNSIAGYLMPEIIETRICKYYLHVLRK